MKNIYLFHQNSYLKLSYIRKNIFACLFTVDNTISLLRHEEACLMRLRFEGYSFHHWAT